MHGARNVMFDIWRSSRPVCEPPKAAQPTTSATSTRVGACRYGSGIRASSAPSGNRSVEKGRGSGKVGRFDALVVWARPPGGERDVLAGVIGEGAWMSVKQSRIIITFFSGLWMEPISAVCRFACVSLFVPADEPDHVSPAGTTIVRNLSPPAPFKIVRHCGEVPMAQIAANTDHRKGSRPDRR